MTRDDLPAMLDAYVECALWSSPDYSTDTSQLDGCLDARFDADDLTTGTVDEMRADCADFYDANESDLADMSPEQAGHDFWLTRNGHGAGFWDRGLGELGERLSAAARVYGMVDLMPLADGTVTS